MARPAALIAAAVSAGACGAGDEERLVVAAAASLKEPLAKCSRGFTGARVRLSFGGSDELAAQIRRGVAPGVFAAADARLAADLAREGLLEEPVEFAGNELVLAIPADSRITTLQGAALTQPDVAMGSAHVPVGAYARQALNRLGDVGRALLARVRTEEPDVKGIVGKLVQGAADAGFVYATDVRAADGRLRAIALPAEAQPRVAYAAAVTPGAPASARRYLAGLTRGACARALRAAGFRRP